MEPSSTPRNGNRRITPIDRLKDVIRRLHRCNSHHVESVSVKEEFNGQIVWEGIVEVFALDNHPKAKRCYAWSYKRKDGSDKFIAVLELPPVDSARKAVQAAIASHEQK